MKRKAFLKTVPVMALLILALAGAVLFLRAGAETGKVSFFAAPAGSAEYAAFSSENDAAFVDTDLKGVMGKIRAYLADREVSDNGAVLVNGEEKEIWVYVSGTVSHSISNTEWTGVSRFTGSNSKAPLIRISSFDASSPENFGTVEVSASNQTFCSLMHDFYFEKIRLVNINSAAASSVKQTAFQLGAATRLTVGEDVFITAKDGKGNLFTNETSASPFLLWAGSSASQGVPDHEARITLLSGHWKAVHFAAGYRTNITEADVTVGGGCCVETLSGCSAAVAAGNLSGGTLGSAGAPFSGTVEIRDHAAVTNYYGLLGPGATNAASAAIYADLTTSVKDQATVANFCGASYTGTLHGEAVNEISGGVFTSAYFGGSFEGAVSGGVINRISGGDFSAVENVFGGCKSGSAVSVTNEISGGTIDNFYAASFSGTVSGNVETRLTGASLARFFGAGEKNGAVLGEVRNIAENSVFSVAYYGGGAEGSTVSGNITNEITSCTVGTAFYGAGRSAVGSAGQKARVFNRAASSSMGNFYGGHRSETGVLYGDIENRIENLVIEEGRFAAGSYQGPVQGTISTFLSGADTFLKNFAATGLKTASCTGKVSVSVSGGSYESFNDRVDTDSEVFVLFDLTGNVSCRCNFSDDAQVSVQAGEGELTLTSGSLKIASLSGTPHIRFAGRVNAGTLLLTLPEGAAENDVAFSSEGLILFENACFYAAELRPNAGTIILQDEGNFALRYLFTQAQFDFLASKGVTPTFCYTLCGQSHEIEKTSPYTSGGSAYQSLIVKNIAPKEVGETIRLSGSAMKITDEYSIAEACRTVIENSQSRRFVSFAKALLDYAKAAYGYFSYSGAAPSEAYYTDLNRASYQAPYPDIAAFSTADTPLKIVGTSVTASDGLRLNFYLRALPEAPSESGWQLKLNDEIRSASFTANGDYYKTSVSVPADQMSYVVSAVIVDENGNEISNRYSDSVVSYCSYVIAHPRDFSAKLVNFCRYMEEYVLQANIYLYGKDIPSPMQTPDYTFSGTPTTDELRDTAVRAMRDMLTVPWFTPDLIRYSKTGAAAGEYTFSRKTIYAGLPYASAGKGIFQFLQYYDPQNGRLTFTDYANFNSVIGNTCGSSVAWALQTVSVSVTGKSQSRFFTIANGFYPLGEVTYDASIEDFGTYETKNIVADNGRNKVIEGYALAKKADLLVRGENSDGGGHTYMLTEDATVVRYSSGSINYYSSYVIIQDQAAVETKDTLDGVTMYRRGSLAKKVSFQELYSSGYIAVTIPEFLDPSDGRYAAYQPSEILSVDAYNGDPTINSFGRLQHARIQTNRAMAVIHVYLEREGEEKVLLYQKLFDRNDLVKSEANEKNNAFDYMLKRLIPHSSMTSSGLPQDERLPDSGVCTVSLEIIMANGETFTYYVTASGTSAPNADGTLQRSWKTLEYGTR